MYDTCCLPQSRRIVSFHPYLSWTGCLEQDQFEIKQENENLRHKNEKLRLEIAGLKSDPYEIEKIAREKLNLIKPGDQVYHIVPTQKYLSSLP